MFLDLRVESLRGEYNSLNSVEDVTHTHDINKNRRSAEICTIGCMYLQF